MELVKRFFIILILSLASRNVIAEVSIPTSVRFNCNLIEECDLIKTEIQDYLESVKTKKLLIDFLKKIPLDSRIKKFSFDIANKELLVNVIYKPKISEISIKLNIDLDPDPITKIISLKESSFFTKQDMESSKKSILKFLKDRGYDNIEIRPDIYLEEGKARVFFNVNVGKVVLVKKVSITTDNDELAKSYLLRILKFRKKPFNIIELKILQDNLANDIEKSGFYFGKVAFEYITRPDSSKEIQVKIHFGEKFNFHFRGNDLFTKQEFSERLKSAISSGVNRFELGMLQDTIGSMYVERGVYNSRVHVRERVTDSKSGILFRNFYVEVEEGHKISVNSLKFQGYLRLELKELENIYMTNSTDLASRGYFDKTYLEKFSKLLKKKYLKKGFLFVEVSDPSIGYSSNGKAVDVSYTVKERQQTTINSISIKGVNTKLENEIKALLINKSSLSLNIIELEEDLAKALAYVREQGYFFARIKNADRDTLLEYSSNFNSVKISVEFDLGGKSEFNSVVVNGYVDTRPKVIKREVQLDTGETITPKKIQRIQNRLTGLGLFGTVKITPYVVNKNLSSETYKVNLLIQVKEKDFNVLQVAPGFRTDLGLKLSTLFSRSNLNMLGSNDSVSISAQANYRLNFGDLDAKRKSESQKIVEGLVKLKYSWPYTTRFFDTSISGSGQRKRFFSFDADIYRGSILFSKTFKKHYSVGLKGQYEQIRQFNATLVKDDDKFTIGGLTPSVTLDFLDDSQNPRKGAWFNLSWEFANPELGSLSNPEKEINFSKIISRNKFYYPVGNWVFALSLAAGYQKNNNQNVLTDANGNTVFNDDGSVRTVGFIPSIKTFRLDGVDAVRGFGDSEINRLENGVAISDLRSQSEVYFSSFKFEPRYLFNDTMALGVFLDAGSLFVNHYKPLDLRTSVGLSFKFLTPVGSLDFNYGVKTQRKDLADGGQESFGRFHLSIGYF